MKHKILLLFRFLVLILTGSALHIQCTDLKVDKTKDTIAKEMNVQENEARNVALNFFSAHTGSGKLRNGADLPDEKEIASVHHLKDKEGDVFMHFVNLKNKRSANPEGDGFVVIAGDRRFIPVLAYGEAGGLDPENLNPGLEIWIDYIKTVYERVKHKNENSKALEYTWKNFGLDIKSFAAKAKIKDDPANPGTGCPENWDNTFGPHLNTHWDQTHPYNFSSQAQTSCGTSYFCEKSPAGCGPVAIAQVWNYYGKPASYPTGCGDWTIPGPCTGFYSYPLDPVLSSSYSCVGFDTAPLREKQIAYLIRDAGNAATSHYGFWGTCNTLTYRSDVRNAFAVRGYNNGSRGDYISNLNSVRNNLSSGHPCIMDGNTSFNFEKWHIWVVDGLRSVMFWYSFPEGPFTCLGQEFTYLHVNWGWGNKDGKMPGMLLTILRLLEAQTRMTTH